MPERLKTPHACNHANEPSSEGEGFSHRILDGASQHLFTPEVKCSGSCGRHGTGRSLQSTPRPEHSVHDPAWAVMWAPIFMAASWELCLLFGITD